MKMERDEMKKNFIFSCFCVFDDDEWQKEKKQQIAISSVKKNRFNLAKSFHLQHHFTYLISTCAYVLTSPWKSFHFLQGENAKWFMISPRVSVILANKMAKI